MPNDQGTEKLSFGKGLVVPFDELVEKTLGDNWYTHKLKANIKILDKKCKPKGGKGKGGK